MDLVFGMIRVARTGRPNPRKIAKVLCPEAQKSVKLTQGTGIVQEWVYQKEDFLIWVNGTGCPFQ